MSLLAYYMTLEQKNKYIRFNGTDARITGITGLDIASQSFAVEVRCRQLVLNRADWVLTVGDSTSASNKQIYGYYSAGNFNFHVRGVTLASSFAGVGVNPLAWHVFRLEYDGTTQRMLWDGVQMASSSSTPFTGAGTMWLADRIDSPATANANVDIDYVKVWRNGVEVLHTSFNDGTITDAYGKTGAAEGTIQFLEE